MIPRVSEGGGSIPNVMYPRQQIQTFCPAHVLSRLGRAAPRTHTPTLRGGIDSRAQTFLVLFAVLSPHFNVQNAHPVREVVKVKLFLPLRICTLTQCLENMQLQHLFSENTTHCYSSYTVIAFLSSGAPHDEPHTHNPHKRVCLRLAKHCHFLPWPQIK